jgi:Ca2+:H+ antiporter
MTTPSLVAISTILLIIPATLYAILNENPNADVRAQIAILSRGTASVLLFIYAIHLIFQLCTHADQFIERTDENARAQLLPPWIAGVILVTITGVAIVCATCLIDNIDSVVKSAHVNRTFIGFILIPIVSSVVNHFTVALAYRDKIDHAIDVTIDSSLQIALLVTPSLVMLSWVMDRNFNLSFDGLEVVALLLAALLCTIIVEDGESNYLKGILSVVRSARAQQSNAAQLMANLWS